MTLAAVAAAWLAARFAGFMPLLWVVVLAAIVVLPPGSRALLDRRWLLAGSVLLLLSWTVAADHELAFRHSLLALLAALLFALARRAHLDDRAVAALAVGVALTALVALGQAFGGLDRARASLDSFPPGWQAAAAARLSGGRVFGTSALPGHFAALMLLVTPLLVERGWRATRWARMGWGAGFLLLAGAAVLTRSLAAPLIGALLLLPLLLRGRGRRIWWLVAGVIVVAGGIAATRADLGTLEPLRLRWVNWRTAAWVFAHHPWLGVGLGGVGQAGLISPTAAANITPYAHNTYLQLLAEFGAAGVVLLGAGVWGLQRLVRRGYPAYPGLALAVAAIPLHNLVDFSAYAPEVLLPWTVLAGTLAGRVCPPPARPARGVVLLAVAAGGAMLAALAWRGEAEMALVSRSGPPWERAMAAARWTPWAVTPLERVAASALRRGAAPAVLASLDAGLAARAWVMPRSASWAEARVHLLLAQGRPGEARTWAREACRRAPWRRDLVELEATCAAR